MEFSEKYSDDAKDTGNKKIISADAFAVGEALNNLIKEIKKVRFKL